MESLEPLKVLEHIEALESGLADLYHKLAERYRSDDEAVAFFEKLEQDEQNHRQMVVMQKRMVQANRRLFGKVEFDQKVIQEILGLISYLSGSPIPIEEALGRVYRIETNSAELYVVTALQKANREMADFLIRLGATFRDHHALVLGFLEQRGLDPASLEKEYRSQHRVSYTDNVLINDRISVTGVDISDGGMFVLTGRSFPVPSEVSLRFQLMDRTVNARAIVQFNQEGVGMGLKFKHLLKDDASAIKAFVSKVAASAQHARGKSGAVMFVRTVAYPESDMRIYLNALVGDGFTVRDASGFIEATLQINSKPPLSALVVFVESESDNNLKFVRLVRGTKEYEDTPIAAITHNYNKEFEAIVLREGADRLLHKMALTPNKLLDELRELMRV